MAHVRLSLCLSDFLDEQPRAHIVKFITMHARTEINARHLHQVVCKAELLHSVQNKQITSLYMGESSLSIKRK